MIDKHTFDTIRLEADNWCLDGKARGTVRTSVVATDFGRDDSTRLDGVLVALEETRGEHDRRATTVYFAAGEIVVPRTIRLRFADPFSEAK